MSHSCNGRLERQVIPQLQKLWENPCAMPSEFQVLPNQIGKGSMGTVFEATCGPNSSFAVKWINGSSDTDNLNIYREIVIQNKAAPYYAKPIYEKWTCHDGVQKKYGYVTDRLDITLTSDLYTLSDEHITLAKKHYLDVFNMMLNDIPKIIKKDIKTEIRELRVRLQKMIDSPYSIRDCEELYVSIKQLCYKYRIPIEVGESHTNNPYKINVPVFFIYDTILQKRKKCFQLLLAMTTLDCLHKKGIYHNDVHTGNFMRKEGEDKYYAIDFGQAGINYTPDIENFIEEIDETFNLKNDLPVQHDVGYLINMCHHLKEIVSKKTLKSTCKKKLKKK